MHNLGLNVLSLLLLFRGWVWIKSVGEGCMHVSLGFAEKVLAGEV